MSRRALFLILLSLSALGAESSSAINCSFKLSPEQLRAWATYADRKNARENYLDAFGKPLMDPESVMLRATIPLFLKLFVMRKSVEKAELSMTEAYRYIIARNTKTQIEKVQDAIDRDYLSRVADDRDLRRSFVRPTAKMVELVEAYVTAQVDDQVRLLRILFPGDETAARLSGR